MDTMDKQEELSVVEVETKTIQKYQHSQEIANIANTIDIQNLESIVYFGKDTANEISKFSDEILKSMEATSVEDSSALLKSLNKIMEKFDPKDFGEKKSNFIQKLFSSAKNSVEALFKKYNTMGGEIDKIYVQLRQYEGEINSSNQVLEDMFKKNVSYYENLEKHILAGKKVLSQLETEVLPKLQELDASGADQLNTVNLSNALQVKDMLEQRVFDLELAKNVSLQSMPQVKMIQQGNYNLVRKINSAFIITIPIFKQSLTQAIALKRQANQAEAMKALDDKTNELLIRNAENTALQSKITAKLASGSSIQVETLEKTWQTIMDGITETEKIQEEMRQKRIEGSKKLQQIQTEYENKAKLKG